MNYVVWDSETDIAQTDWATMLEVGAILLDNNFKEIERFEARCRLPKDRVPTATALCINKPNVDLLTKGNLSHYQMLGQLEAIFKKWSPAIFMGWSNIGFDDEMIRNEFFRGIRYPYITNATPNKRHDGLNIARGAHAVDESVLKTEINAKGNAVMKLESLARMNGFESSGAHSALFDAELTVKVLGLIKKNQPQTWDKFLRTANKADTEVIIKKEKIFTLAEYHFGKNYKYVVAPLHPKHCIDNYNWGRAVDLKVDPTPLLNMSISELKGAIKKLKFLKTIRSNKAPIILDASYGMQVEPYRNLDPDLIKERAKLVTGNEKFSQNVCNILRE